MQCIRIWLKISDRRGISSGPRELPLIWYQQYTVLPVQWSCAHRDPLPVDMVNRWIHNRYRFHIRHEGYYSKPDIRFEPRAMVVSYFESLTIFAGNEKHTMLHLERRINPVILQRHRLWSNGKASSNWPRKYLWLKIYQKVDLFSFKVENFAD